MLAIDTVYGKGENRKKRQDIKRHGRLKRKDKKKRNEEIDTGRREEKLKKGKRKCNC